MYLIFRSLTLGKFTSHILQRSPLGIAASRAKMINHAVWGMLWGGIGLLGILLAIFAFISGVYFFGLCLFPGAQVAFLAYAAVAGVVFFLGLELHFYADTVMYSPSGNVVFLPDEPGIFPKRWEFGFVTS